MAKIQLLLHNPLPGCAAATEATLKMLPGGACSGFARDTNGDIAITDGWVECETANPRFLEFAVINQGYVKAVKP